MQVQIVKHTRLYSGILLNVEIIEGDWESESGGSESVG